MKKFQYLLLVTFAALFLATSPQKIHAQVAVQIGPPPVCPYGYFDYPPYDCAPYGYYGPEWFTGGIFIGAGPWFHGGAHFWGPVNNHFDRNDGYHGEYPSRGAHWAVQQPRGHVENFHGNEMRDAHNHSNLGATHEHGGGDHGDHGGHR